MAIAEVEEEADGAHKEDDEGANGGAGGGKTGGGSFNLLAEWGSEGDLDGIAVNVVEAEVEGVFVGDADGGGRDRVFDLYGEGNGESLAGRDGFGGPGEDALIEGGAGGVGDVGVF